MPEATAAPAPFLPQGPLLEGCDLNEVVSGAIAMAAKAQSDSDREQLVGLA